MSSSRCEECQIGRCRPVTLIYMRKVGRHMLMLPNAPACKCDMCGHSQFDNGFLLAMQILLEKMADNGHRHERKKQPVAEPSVDWTAVEEVVNFDS